MPVHLTVTDLPAAYDITVWQGDGWARAVRLTVDGVPYDLTGAEVTAQIRRCRDRDAELLATIEINVVDPAGGGFVMHLADEITSVLPDSSAWDLQIVDPGGEPRTLLYGLVLVPNDVTVP